MISLIIFGTKGVTSCVTTGSFGCPTCAQERPFQHMRVRRFFTLYWIPLIPLDVVGEYIECLFCHMKFKQSVLGPATG